MLINAIALAWVFCITLLFSIPPNELAGWSLLLLSIFMALYWHLDAKHRFKGPQRASAAEMHRAEAALQS